CASEATAAAPDLPKAHATFCRRRHQPSKPPPASNRPGSPAPTIGPGTAAAGPNTAMQPKLAGHGFSALVPASGTKTSPLNGSTVIECALVVEGSCTVWIMLPPSGSSVTTSKNRLLFVPLLPVT